MKTCARCREEYPLAHYIKDPRYKDGFHGNCRKCRCYFSRKHTIRKQYGMTPEEYDSIMNETEECASCGSIGRRLVMDHDHVTGKVRGILCSNCNTALGLLGDDPRKIAQLKDYLIASLSYS